MEVWSGIKIAQPRMGATVREFLEAFVAQQRAGREGGGIGMVDMVVGRYGKAATEVPPAPATVSTPPEPARGVAGLGFPFWPTPTRSTASSRNQSPARLPPPPSLLPVTLPKQEVMPKELTASDGCIFPGAGHLDPKSVRDISVWMSDLYVYSEDLSNPARRKRGKRQRHSRIASASPSDLLEGGGSAEGSPQPQNVRGRSGSTEDSPMADARPGIDDSGETQPVGRQRPQSMMPAHRAPLPTRERSASVQSHSRKASTTNNGKFLSMITFGWKGGNTQPPQDLETPASTRDSNEASPAQPEGRKSTSQKRRSPGQPRFLYGFTGNLEDDAEDDEAGLNIDGVDVGGRIPSRRITEKVVWLYAKENGTSQSTDIKGKGRCRDDGGVGSKEHGVLDIEGNRIVRRRSTEQTIKPPVSILKEFSIVVYMVRSWPLPCTHLELTFPRIPHSFSHWYSILTRHSSPHLPSTASYTANSARYEAPSSPLYPRPRERNLHQGQSYTTFSSTQPP